MSYYERSTCNDCGKDLHQHELRWGYCTRCDNLKSAREEVSRLRLANSELEKDREDLEWMISRSAYISHSRDGEYCNVWLPPDEDGNDHRPAQGYPQKCYDNAREAIAAARKEGV